MDQFLEFISQAYVYIPASIMAVIAVLVPAIVKIAKIATSNEANTVRLALIKKELKDLYDVIIGMQDEFIAELELEVESLLKEKRITLNKKQIEIIDSKVSKLQQSIEKHKIIKTKVECGKETQKELETKKKKVRVKVVKKAIQETQKDE